MSSPSALAWRVLLAGAVLTCATGCNERTAKRPDDKPARGNATQPAAGKTAPTAAAKRPAFSRLGSAIPVDDAAGVQAQLGPDMLVQIRPGLLPLRLHPVTLDKNADYVLQVQALEGSTKGFVPHVMAVSRRPYDEAEIFWAYDTWDLPDGDRQLVGASESGHPTEVHPFRTTLETKPDALVAVSCWPCGAPGAGPEALGRYRVRLMKGKSHAAWPPSRAVAAPTPRTARGAAVRPAGQPVRGALGPPDVRVWGKRLTPLRGHPVKLAGERTYTVEVRRESGAESFTPDVHVVTAAGKGVPQVAEPFDVSGGVIGHFRRASFTVPDDGDYQLLVGCNPCGRNRDLMGAYEIRLVEGYHPMFGAGLLPAPLRAGTPLKAADTTTVNQRVDPSTEPSAEVLASVVRGMNELCPDTWCEGEFDFEFQAMTCAATTCTLRFSAKHFEATRSQAATLTLPRPKLQCRLADDNFCTELGPAGDYNKHINDAIAAWEKQALGSPAP